MYDCTYFLYKSFLSRFPYVPSEDVEQDAERLEQIKAHPNHILEPYQINMINLLDCIEALADDRSCHAFRLGLDAGLSIAQESRHLQAER